MSIGLLAGAGKLPIEFLKSAALNGVDVVVFAIKGVTDREIDSLSAKSIWIEPFKVGEFLRQLKRSGVTEFVMLGKIDHRKAFSLRGMDIKAVSLLMSLPDRKPQTIIRKLIEEVEKCGIRAIDPFMFLKHLIVPSGVICGEYTDDVKMDAMIGMEFAKKVASYDVGQTVVVKNGVIVAVEGVEGTDACIKRAASLTGGGFVVCKSARCVQDMRIDVPTVGPSTVDLIGRLGGKALIFEAGKTFLLDKDLTVDLANKFGVTVVSMKI